MYKLSAVFAVLLATTAVAKTVILYDDGTQYTVKDNEHVYVSNYRKLYYQKAYSRGDILFHLTLPNTKRDQVFIENPNPVGSQEWCEAHDLHANGYTFEDQAWYQYCDVTDDGIYNICDWYEPSGSATFTELQWQDECNNGEPWDGS